MFSFFEFFNNATDFLNFNNLINLESNFKNNHNSIINFIFVKKLFLFTYYHSYNIFINSIIIYMLYIYVSFLIIFVFFLILKNVNFNLHFLITSYVLFFLNTVEKEIFNLNFKLRLILFFILFLSIYNLEFFFYSTFPIIFSFNFQFLLILVVVVLFIPLSLVYSYSGYFLSYIRGASLKKNIFFESLVDCLNLISFFLRINIQFIRIMLINFMFFMYEESYYDLVYPFYNLNNLNVNCLNITDYIDYYLTYFFIYFFQWLYEITHYWVIFTMQSTVFCLIVTLLIQFLYSLYLIKNMIFFFKNKRVN